MVMQVKMSLWLLGSRKTSLSNSTSLFLENREEDEEEGVKEEEEEDANKKNKDEEVGT